MSLDSDFNQKVQQATASFKAWSDANGSADFEAFLAASDLTDSVANEVRRRFEQALEIDGPSAQPPANNDSFPDTFAVKLPSNQNKDIPDSIGRYHVTKVLGKGGFGIVYLAYDDQLQRSVAVKVPHAHLVSRPDDAEAYLTEARTVANLDHPHIVPVYDVGCTADFPCFVVSKYVEGIDLAAKLKRQRLGFREAAELVATVADALHYAHKQGLVHRDVKPGNILMGNDGQVYVVDFGVALKEQNLGKGPGFAGTPVYMSPEQARGEGHRVDGRSDIYSLGTVLYELLVGRRTFNAETQTELLQQISELDVKPPRQIDDSVPRELERICLKSLAKRASDRYTTALDLAEDLRHYITEHPSVATSPTANIPPTAPAASDSTKAVADSETPKFDSDRQPIRIVPKGLRSFDAHDADFFLELLPGPRDRDGLPDSIRFWKTRIEETDPDRTFSVGLIYGPSGCGKSSLVKAGLLPRLSRDVTTVYVEATPDDTETRLLHGIRRYCPALTETLSLKETLAALRRGEDLVTGHKVLIVLDQFEQWLHSHQQQENSELVQALRQCDGQHVQCIVMVRDDFWMAATRFMRELEVRLLEAHNSAAVDLFSERHAEKVLAAFGRAFGTLPESLSETSSDQREFIRQSVASLAEEAKVICVRLSLFAEMTKGKTWTPATLREVGGTEGVGVTFLEETFSASTAPPEHRYHQRAARAILKSLLPESGTDIKGEMKSYDELLAASGYANRQRDFEDVLKILDSEIRLITPTDPEGMEVDDNSVSPVQPGQKYYQLTHDYLVPSLRDWLTRKQRETRRGRAELRLAERSALWNANPENRRLPSTWEYMNIRVLTDSKKWKPPQRKMMKRASGFYGVRAALFTLILIVMTIGGFQIRRIAIAASNDQRAAGFVTALLNAETNQVPDLIKQMGPYREWVDPKLERAIGEYPADSPERLKLGLARLATDTSEVNFLANRLLASKPEQIATIRTLLSPHREKILGQLWEATADECSLLQSASALAEYDAENESQWSAIAERVADKLVGENALRVAVWMQLLKPAKQHLIVPLGEIFRNSSGDRSQTEIDLATNVLEDYASGDIGCLSELLFDGEPKQFLALFDEFTANPESAIERLNREMERDSNEEEDPEILARRRCNAAVALIRMGKTDRVWPLLKHSPDPRLRSWIVNRIHPLKASTEPVIQQLELETDVSIRRALVLILGTFDSFEDRDRVSGRLLQLYREDPDPGIHSAARWVLQKWGLKKDLQDTDNQLATGESLLGHGWYVTKTNAHTMSIVEAPVEFEMGSPTSELGRSDNEDLHRVKIDRSFAISTTEVTIAQFNKFNRENREFGIGFPKNYAPDHECPQIGVNWYTAAAYCRWLSEQEGIPEDQMCYPPIQNITAGLKLPEDFLQRTGYRLPTEAEWEYACRAGAVTSRYYGETEDLLANYAWYAKNSGERSWPVASLQPNDLGLFDMQGNVFEWCQQRYGEYGPAEANGDGLLSLNVDDTDSRLLRGGSFSYLPQNVRSASRYNLQPANRLTNFGFRLARTYD